MRSSPSQQRAARWTIALAAAALCVAAVLLWRYTPLAQWADADRIATWMASAEASAWTPVAVIAAFVLGGLLVFPLTLLIAATAIVFDPLTAIALSTTGALANAITLYAIGRFLVRDTVHGAFGEHVTKLNRSLESRGIIAVAAVRMVPIAPFTLVNLAAGSVNVRVRDYVIGTALGLLPGTSALTAFGRQLREIFERPTLSNVALLTAIVIGWIALSLGLQRLVSRRKPRTD